MPRTGWILTTGTLMVLSLTLGWGWGRAMAAEPAAAVPARSVASFRVAELAAKRAQAGSPWLAFLERDSLTAGLYELAAGQPDRQSPHTRDEIYYVIAGEGTLSAGDQEIVVAPGSVVYVAAGVDHRFHDVEGDLSVLVIFAGAAR